MKSEMKRSFQLTDFIAGNWSDKHLNLELARDNLER